MAIIASSHARSATDTPYPATAGAATVYRASMTVPTTVQVGDILDLAVIPAGTRPVDLVIDCDDLDSGGSPLITFDVGIMSGTPGDTVTARTCGAEFISASQIARTGGTARPTLATAFRVGQSSVERSIGVKITAVAATAVEGTIGCTLTIAAV